MNSVSRIIFVYLLVFGVLSPSENHSYGQDGTEIPVNALGALESLDVINILSHGSGVDYGGGGVDAEFIRTLLELPSMLEKIIANNSVVGRLIPDAQMNLLIKILNSLKNNEVTESQLRFDADQDYFIDGVYRIAKTKKVPGAIIYLNPRMFYSVKSTGTISPNLDKGNIIQVLIHELGHQQGVESHSELNRLGALVAKYWRESTSEFQNLDFEEYTDTALLHWQAFINLGKSYIGVEKTNIARGTAAIVMQGAFNNSKLMIRQCQKLAMDFQEHSQRNITISALVASDLDAGARGRMIISLADNYYSRSYSSDNGYYITIGDEVKSKDKIQILSGAMDYHLIKSALPLTRTNPYVCIYFDLDGKGKLFVDDVRVEVD